MDGWTSLEDYFIEKIVFYLKKNERWTRDGPTLRLLNKHWSTNINNQIQSLSPHLCREVTKEDISSISKFHNLTSVNLDDFIHAGSGRGTVDEIFAVLRGMPQLSKIQVSFDLIARSNWSVNGHFLNNLNRLTGVTSLKINSGVINRIGATCIRFDALPLTELIIDPCINAHGFVFDNFPYLKRLSVTQMAESQLCSSALLKSLDKFEVSFCNNSVPTKSLSWLKDALGIYSIKMGQVSKSQIKTFSHLDGLRHLEIMASEKDVNTEEFSYLIKRLDALKVTCLTEWNQFRDMDFVKHPLVLKSLKLSGFRFSAIQLLGMLPCLRKLELSMCDITDGEDFLLAASYKDSKVGAIMRNIKELVIEDGFNPTTWCWIPGLIGVQRLGLKFFRRLSHEWWNYLKRLPSLRELAVWGVLLPIKETGYRKVVRFLSGLERVCLNVDGPRARELESALKSASPQLKVEWELNDFQNFAATELL